MLDGTALLRWGQLCLAGLEEHRDEINALNVFPVADADTGTNLLSTMRAAVRAAEIAAEETLAAEATPAQATAADASAEVAENAGAAAVAGEGKVGPARDAAPITSVLRADAVAGAMARAATVGARGNSGIILSQVLRGVADSVGDRPLSEAALRRALRRAAVLVREALSSPVEGTMLTVLDRAAERAADCSEQSLAAVALAAADGAAKALGETPAQLGVLREAGVVDAGARGLLVLLDQLVAVTSGQAPARPEYRRQARPAEARSDRARSGTAAGNGAAGSGTVGASGGARVAVPESAVAQHVSVSHDRVVPQYEVMYLLADTDERRMAELRDLLGGLGDSVVVVGDGAGMWSAHVHCADAGAAVEAGLAAGRLSGIRIENLAVSGHAPQGPLDRGILAVASGAGAVRLFEDAGAAVLEGEVTADVLLAAIQRMPQREVLVLPNGALPAHELVAVSVAARDGHREVLMLPSGSMVQGLAALSMHDAGRAAADDAFAMSEAAAGTRWGALRIAPERALTIVGTCAAGDGLGLVGHDVVVIDPDVRAAARTLLDRMLGLGGELVTMLMGAQAPQGLSEELAEHVAAGFPGVEVVVYPGGQAVDLVQIGVE
ncbi:DAK2 domain-containing protein [Nocardia acididurans]|uniref:DAK2 domain-containing protein n=1 Tax=Nocardia acididurans TaxID=2802282 RepID=UPI0027DDF1B0|nr:DAK2 domain-containing protein [Nocardia acididurans]